MEEIRVDEYVRFETGQIDKIINIECWADDDIWLVGQNSYTKTTDDVIVKHSKNIIDLIEVGDYVNGKLIHHTDIRKNSAYIYYGNGKTFVDYQIKSIVTKEMMESVEYRLN